MHHKPPDGASSSFISVERAALSCTQNPGSRPPGAWWKTVHLWKESYRKPCPLQPWTLLQGQAQSPPNHWGCPLCQESPPSPPRHSTTPNGTRQPPGIRQFSWEILKKKKNTRQSVRPGFTGAALLQLAELHTPAGTNRYRTHLKNIYKPSPDAVWVVSQSGISKYLQIRSFNIVICPSVLFKNAYKRKRRMTVV